MRGIWIRCVTNTDPGAMESIAPERGQIALRERAAKHTATEVLEGIAPEAGQGIRLTSPSDD
jgi:hypothetical protein